MTRIHAWLILFAAGLAGCDSSTPDAMTVSDVVVRPAVSSSIQSPAPVATGSRAVYGNGTKGPLVNATVELFAINSGGFAQDGALATTQTDASGNWQLNVNRSDPVLVRVSGGSYVDEADTNELNRRIVDLSADQFLESVLLPGESSVAVTVFTHALLQKSRRETGFNDFSEVVNNNRALFVQAYGFDVLSVLPSDPLAPTGSDESIAYAMSVGGVANAINALSIASNDALPEYAHILSVVEDLVDCRLDGLGTGGQQVVNPALAGYQELSLEQQVLRFRNNNYAAYEGVSQAEVNALPCDELGGVADTLAPVVTSFADQVDFEAQSPQGVVLSDSQRAALVDLFVATDDRSGDLVWRVDIPQQLGIGSTSLIAVVKDGWGNETQVDWEITVADTTPPEIDGQNEVSAQAVGDVTFVELVQPQVSDRVTFQTQIDLVNDAPNGFPVGSTPVVWTARDEAGNASTFDQIVTVNSVAPEVMPAPPSVDADSDVDFSIFFNDPDGTTLNYSVEGLPDGTGLSIDPVTGVLTGTPSPADLAVQPIELTISATDGQNVVSLQTTVIVTAPNTPPTFSVSQTSITQNEDFVDQVLDIQPAQVPDSEIDQVVVYSLLFDSDVAQNAAPFSAAVDSQSLSVTLTSKPDASGVASFRLVANDGQAIQNEFVQQITVEVLPVNDAPEVTGAHEPLRVAVGEPFELGLSTRVSDVDDTVLTFTSGRLPSGLRINDEGQLVGMALPVDALSDEIALLITASDTDDERVDFVVSLIVTNPDSDGDGLTDYFEQQIGFDAMLSDSDGDSLGDSIEYLAGTDINPSNVVYVSTTGSDASAGDRPDEALASLTEAGIRLALLPLDEPALVLIERDSQVQGAIELTGAERVIIGSVDFATLQSQSSERSNLAPSTTFSSPTLRALTFNNCQSCAALNVKISGGAAISVMDSDVTLTRLHVVGSRAFDGGALWSQRSTITAAGLHLALNSAKRGGAIALDSNSQLRITDSVLTGNLAQQSGGAIAVLDSAMTASNVALSSNTSPIAPAIDAVASDITLSNLTVAYNLVKALSTDELFRCRTSALIPCSDSTAITLQDSLVVGNRDAANVTVDLAGIRSIGQGNFVEPDRASSVAMGLSSNEPFAVGYFSDDVMLLDAGSRSALAADLDGYFSEVDSVFVDAGKVEPGVHAERPIVSIDQYTAVANLSNDGLSFGLRAIDISFVQNGESIQGMHRVSVAITSDNDRAIAVGTGVLPNDPFNAVPAVSLGNGRYRVWVTNDVVLGKDLLYLRLDDDQLGLEVLPVCQQSTCGSAEVTGIGFGNTGLDQERVVPAINLAD